MNRFGTPLSQLSTTLRWRAAPVSALPVSPGPPGWRKAGSLPSIRGTVHATRCIQTRTGSSRQDQHLRTQWCFSIGIWYFHHSQEGWPRSLDIRLPCPAQMHQEETLPATSHFRHSVQTNRIHVLLEVGHQHGLLYLQA